jgi:hypothetical protein
MDRLRRKLVGCVVMVSHFYCARTNTNLHYESVIFYSAEPRPAFCVRYFHLSMLMTGEDVSTPCMTQYIFLLGFQKKFHIMTKVIKNDEVDEKA